MPICRYHHVPCRQFSRNRSSLPPYNRSRGTDCTRRKFQDIRWDVHISFPSQMIACGRGKTKHDWQDEALLSMVARGSGHCWSSPVNSISCSVGYVRYIHPCLYMSRQPSRTVNTREVCRLQCKPCISCFPRRYDRTRGSEIAQYML